MPDPDLINSPQQGWNEPGELFNDDQPTPQVFRYLTPLNEDPDQDPVTWDERRDTLSTYVDPEVQERVRSVDLTPVQRTALVGSYAAIRAASVAHQHRVGFWDEEGVLGFIAEATAPDPTDDELNQIWEDFQLFSYVPSDLMPTQEQFRDLARPQKRISITRSNLSNVGLKEVGGPQASTSEDDRNTTLSADPLIAPPAAFSEIGLSFCQQELNRVLGGG